MEPNAAITAFKTNVSKFGTDCAINIKAVLDDAVLLIASDIDLSFDNVLELASVATNDKSTDIKGDVKDVITKLLKEQTPLMVRACYLAIIKNEAFGSNSHFIASIIANIILIKTGNGILLLSKRDIIHIDSLATNAAPEALLFLESKTFATPKRKASKPKDVVSGVSKTEEYLALN